MRACALGLCMAVILAVEATGPGFVTLRGQLCVGHLVSTRLIVDGKM